MSFLDQFNVFIGSITGFLFQDAFREYSFETTPKDGHLLSV